MATQGLAVAPTADPALAVAFDAQRVLFVDVLDPRFWLVHTASSARAARSSLRNMIWKSCQVDWCWFPSSFLRALQGDARARWFTADFRGAALLPESGLTDRRLRVQLEGDGATDLFDDLLANEKYRRAAALSAVGVEVEDDGRVLAEVAERQGRFAPRGGTFEGHVGFVAQAVNRYRALVESVENGYQLAWSGDEDSGLRVDGGVLTFELGRPIDDFERFLGGLFSCRDPFRLWAVPRRYGDDFATAEVVDLHIGERFSMDIARTYLRVYLTPGVCGNTALRLLTNLQHGYDATVADRDHVLIPTAS